MEPSLEVYETLPIVPLRDVVVFPHMMMPFVIGRPSSTRALERKIGARGLRMIIEDLMLDLMYQVPNQKKVREVTITREVVLAKDKPITLIEKAG